MSDARGQSYDFPPAYRTYKLANLRKRTTTAFEMGKGNLRDGLRRREGCGGRRLMLESSSRNPPSPAPPFFFLDALEACGMRHASPQMQVAADRF